MARRCNTESGNAVADLAQAQAELGGGGGAVKPGFLQHPGQDVAFLLVQEILQIFRHDHRRVGRQVEVQQAVFTECDGAVQNVFQFPDIAVEGQRTQLLHHGVAQHRDFQV